MKKPDFNLPPIFKKLKRGGPAVILPKDSGLIISYTGLNRESLVVEAGAGSAFLTTVLAGIAKQVTSYELKEEFAKFAEENVKRAGLTNVTIKNKDVMQGIDEKEVDLVVLDMRDSSKAVTLAHGALKKGGYLVGYLPNTDQVKEFGLECAKHFEKVFTLESIIREYDVEEYGIRPVHFGLMHSAYLVFARK
ncbi:MAG: rRNA adenine N-6-methyltransferase family protein [Candidatus Micrarchaeota archaeon]